MSNDRPQHQSASHRALACGQDLGPEEATAKQRGCVVAVSNATESSSPLTSCAASCDDEVSLEAEILFTFGRYVGHVDPVSGLRQGHGVLFYNSGNVYDGEWYQGAAHGLGEKRYQNGDTYRGTWRHGKRSGRGGYLFAAGHYFEGVYQDDEANGYGVLSTVNGDRYTGQWRAGKKHGKGREILQSGQVFVGNWQHDKKQGRGRMYLPGATRSICGVWHNDYFFRELTEEEMGRDAEIDVVDTFAVPRRDPEGQTVHNVDATGRPVGEGVGEVGQLADRLFSGMEERLEALGQALDRVTREAEDDTDLTSAVELPGFHTLPSAEVDGDMFVQLGMKDLGVHLHNSPSCAADRP